MSRPKRQDEIAIGGDWLVHTVFVMKAGQPLHRFCKPVIEKE